MENQDSPKFVVIGGGTGSFTLLTGLKRHVRDITALVNTVDDGRGNVVYDEMGILPPGDIRQCLVALSDSPKVRELFNYRLHEGANIGDSFGDIFLSTVEKMTNSFEDAVALASDVLHLQGRVIPITTTNTQLVMKEPDGRMVKSRAVTGLNKRPDLSLAPTAALTEAGREAILAADMIVIAPGNLYGSLAPALLVEGIRSALRQTSAKVVYVCNLVNKPRQTDDFMVDDYAAEIERFIGAKVIDYVIYNTDEPPKTLLEKYTHDGERIVEFELDKMDDMHYHAIGLPLIAQDPLATSKQDPAAQASRSLIRHDSNLLARQLMSIYFE